MLDDKREAVNLSREDALGMLAMVQTLGYVHDLPNLMHVVRKAARDLAQADGVTFVLRDNESVYYADEDAIEPLWKGRSFPIENCISGWCILNRQQVAIEDIYSDDRIPIDAYKTTFVKSLVATPIRREDPVASINVYWSHQHTATARELELLQILADSTAMALTNIALIADLKNTEVALQEALKIRDSFLSIAGHELKTPLTALQLQLQGATRMLQNLESTERLSKAQGRLEKVSTHVLRFSRLVDELLDVSTITAGRLKLRSAPMDFTEATNEVASRFQESAKRAGCEIKLNTDDHTPGLWDRVRYEQILTNLLSNALKYGVGKPIEIELKGSDDLMTLKVTDHGIGIDEEHKRRIFNRFERAVSERNYGGFGLGLWIVRKILEEAGGEILLDSEPEHGATFQITFPRRLNAPEGVSDAAA